MTNMAAPPWTKLRDLEYASLQLERLDSESDKSYSTWLKMLIAPGGSLGGARPKASVLDENGHPWIAKFPSRNDEINIGKSLDLVRIVAPLFRVKEELVVEIIGEVVKAVRKWGDVAKKLKLPAREIALMKNAFRVADHYTE